MANYVKFVDVSFPCSYNGIKGTAKGLTTFNNGSGKRPTTTTEFFPTNCRPFYRKTIDIKEVKI